MFVCQDRQECLFHHASKLFRDKLDKIHAIFYGSTPLTMTVTLSEVEA